jgi:hypothetical protein
MVGYGMRARNIKPGFFKNDLLAECHPLARILFEGLWCMADREGRLKDRPQRIRAEILPYDILDGKQNPTIDELINELAQKKDCDGTAAFINRYQVNGTGYIQVIHFKENQHPHVNEKPSDIPAPENSGTSTVQAPEQSRTNPSDSLITDSLNTEELSVDSSKGVESENSLCPHKKIIELYHKIIPEMPKVRIWNEDQRSWLRARWKEDPNRQVLTWWEKFFTWIRESDWLMGRTKEEFQCDLEWLIRKRNFAKIANGRYHKRRRGQYSGIEEWLRLSQEKVEKEG